MSQALARIVYGIPCTYEMQARAVELGLVPPGRNRKRFDEIGFTSDYSANGDYPVWCGVVLDTIKEGDNGNLSRFKMEPTDEQHLEFTQRFTEIPKELQSMSGDPSVLVMWASS